MEGSPEFCDSEQIGIMYSGGKDSTALLLTLAKIFPKKSYHLLVCNNGHYYPEELKNKLIENISTLIGLGFLERDQIYVRYFDFRHVLTGFAIRNMSKEFAKYDECYLCSACKILMHAVTGVYCQDVRIGLLLDGCTYAQRYYSEQAPGYKELVGSILRENFNVALHSPLYNNIRERSQIDELLISLGFNPDLSDREKGGQAICSIGGLVTPPRDQNGKIDFNAYERFKENSLKYASDKLTVLFGKESVVQHREGGIMSFPSYFQQVLSSARNFESLIGY